jgi:polar amino acid transport system substrate-binding protein
MKRSILGWLLTLALLIPAFGASAQGSAVLGRIVKEKTLRVGISGNQPPLNFKTKSGELMGLEIDLARGLAATMGVEVQFVQKPFGDLLEAVAKGEVDLVMSGMSITPERNMKVAFVGPYHLSGKAILTKSSLLAAAENAEDIDDTQLKLSALRGSTSARFVEAVFPDAQLSETDDHDQAVALVIDDKVQAMVADFEACLLRVMLNPKANLTMTSKPLTIEPIGIAVAPGDALLVNFLENTLGALELSGLLEALRTRWLENSDWLEQLP